MRRMRQVLQLHFGARVTARMIRPGSRGRTQQGAGLCSTGDRREPGLAVDGRSSGVPSELAKRVASKIIDPGAQCPGGHAGWEIP